jgi:hypothetical protein
MRRRLSKFVSLIGLAGCALAVFIVTIIVIVWITLAYVGVRVWNAPAVQEGLGYQEPAAEAPATPPDSRRDAPDEP